MSSPIFATPANMEPIIKEYYDAQRVINVTYKTNPLLGLIPKFRDWSGYNYRLPLQYVNPAGLSSVFSTAQSTQTPSVYADFLLTPQSFYSLASITGPTILQTRNDKGAFVNALTREIDSSMRAHSNVIQTYLYGDGSGALAQIASVTSPNIVTLVDKTQVARFTVNMSITFCASLTGGTPSAAVVVTGTNLSAGTVTFNTAYPTGSAANGYLFIEDSYNNVPTGLAGWVPTTAPTTGDDFFGQDRSPDPTRLAGVRMGCKGWPMMQTLTQLAYQIYANAGVGPDTVFLHPARLSQLIQELGSQSIYRPEMASPMESPKITYAGGTLNTGWGEIRLQPDIYCPFNQLWMLKFDNWCLYVQRDLFSIIEDDNQRILRTASDDGVEVRIRSYLNMGCDSTAYQGVADFTTAA